MRKFIVGALVFLLAANCWAQNDRVNSWALEVSAGPGFTMGPSPLDEVLPHSINITGGVVYMITPNVGLMPVNISYARYMIDDDFLPYYAKDVDMSVSALTLAPGVLFIGPLNENIDIVGQITIGLYRNTVKIEDLDDSSNGLAFTLLGGLDFDLNEKVALITRVGYGYGSIEEFADEESVSSLKLMGGLKYYF